MNIHPSLPDFTAMADGQDLVPVYRQLVSDTLTPVLAYERLPDSATSFLFESVIGGERVGRYSFVGSCPLVQFKAYGNNLRIERDGKVEERTVADPLHELAELVKGFRAYHSPDLPRFCGGAVGYAGYDTIRYSENLPNAPTDDRNLPDLSFGIYDQMAVFDNIRKTMIVVVHADVRTDAPEVAYQKACDRLNKLCDALTRPTTTLRPLDIDLNVPTTRSYKSNFQQHEFESAVEKCRQYIRAGDIFQVVISQRLQLDTSATALQIYRALRVVNPSPFMFLLRTPEVELIGSSPEIMVRVVGDEVTIRPLAGTRKRGATPADDIALEKELLADEKERAEHVMLVDLARNDVGRVARYGTIQLSDVMRVERYSHVMHITSNVTGRMLPGLTALDALRAGLPAGTVSGAPKVRAMEIIDEIEPHRRGPYAGAVGYLDFSGEMDTCIALRTLVLQGSKAYVQAGAGIVADSVPASEYEETLNKARGMLRAIEIAETQLDG
ncbi:MAG: anthranilate synthase component I [Planctomycetaceae bacterium]|nr:anthranilate synthase component I [Planctomycetaceae bacterium]